MAATDLVPIPKAGDVNETSNFERLVNAVDCARRGDGVLFGLDSKLDRPDPGTNTGAGIAGPIWPSQQPGIQG